MRIFKTERDRRISNAIMFVVFGLIMILFSAFALDLLAYVSGAFFLLVGIFYLVCFFMGFHFFDPLILLLGVFNTVLGSLVLANPSAFATWILYLIAILMTYQGAVEIFYGLDLRKLGVRNWWSNLIYGITAVTIGIALFVLEITRGIGTNVLSIIAGSSLCLIGAAELCFILLLHRSYSRRKPRTKEDEDKVVAEQ